MKQPQRPGRPSETTRDLFRTPRRLPLDPPPRSAVSKSTTSKRTRSPDPLSSARVRQRNSSSNLRAQPTLTQIDFVTQATQSGDNQLDYIDQPRPRDGTPTTKESTNIDDGSDDDAEFRSPPPARSSRISKCGMSDRERGTNERPPKRKKSSKRDPDRSHAPRRSETPRAGVGTKRNRKFLEKSAGKRDKTLTQMDFVRRYITIDDDDDEDDVNMGYIQPATEENSAQDGPPVQMAGAQKQEPQPQQSFARPNRRAVEVEVDLSTGEPISQSSDTQHTRLSDASKGRKAFAGPVTPQKLRKLEIPSSQSPESPGIAIITSSQFRSATRSPLRGKPLNLAHHPSKPIKEEAPEPQLGPAVWHGPGHGMLPQDSARVSPKAPDSSAWPRSDPSGHAASSTQSVESTPQGLVPEGNETPRDKYPNKERTVVYDTDAESDYGNSDDGLDSSLASPPQGNETRRHVVHDTPNSQEASKDDAEELPLPPVQLNAEADFSMAAEAPMSDASICYQRLHPATQFPHEPIPALNTQNLADLFPHEHSVGDQQSDPPQPSQELASTQTQTQSQDRDKSTDFVPESSPVRGPENIITAPDTPFQRPRAPGSVVQVESSQPVDRSTCRPRILSRSQLLTSSVMESIPLPNFWTGSQDSVGEPYSMPDR